MKVRLLSVLAAASVLCTTGWARAQCATDRDCKGDRVCEDGQCRAPAVTTPPAAVAAPAESAPPVVPPPAVGRALPVVVPPALAKPRLRHRSTPLMTAGIVVASASPVVLVIGAVISGNLYRSCLGSDDRTSSNPRYDGCKKSQLTRAWEVLGVTAALAAVGVPMIIYGAHNVPAQPPVTATFVPWVGLRAAGLELRLDL